MFDILDPDHRINHDIFVLITSKLSSLEISTCDVDVIEAFIDAREDSNFSILFNFGKDSFNLSQNFSSFLLFSIPGHSRYVIVSKRNLRFWSIILM